MLTNVRGRRVYAVFCLLITVGLILNIADGGWLRITMSVLGWTLLVGGLIQDVRRHNRRGRH